MADSTQIKDQVDVIVSQLNDALADGKITTGEGWELISDGCFNLAVRIRSLTLDKDERREYWNLAAERVYDEAWIPYNIPGIGPLIEGVLDKLGRQGVPIITDFLFGMLDNLITWVLNLLGNLLGPDNKLEADKLFQIISSMV